MSDSASMGKPGFRWALWLPLALFAGFVALVLVGLFRPAPREVASAMVGKPLPQFSLKAAIPDRPGLASADFTGGKPRLGGIGRRANHYLRRQLIHGARAVISRLAGRDDRRSAWLKGIVARAGFNKALVALANKTARIAWVLLARKECYMPG